MNLKFLFKKIYNLWHGVIVFYDVCGEFTIQLDLNLTTTIHYLMILIDNTILRNFSRNSTISLTS